jgi:thiamine-phosphate pyrophosphorylase
MARYDYSLYLVTDRPLCGGRDLEDVVADAVAGGRGATVVQLREKTATTREFVEIARRLRAMLTPLGVPLFVNDRLDVALAARTDGVHLGQSDMTVADAREIAGAGLAIGLTVDTMSQALAAEGLDVAYLGVGPIYETTTKTDVTQVWGLDKLAELRRRSSHVLVGIGGIHPGNCAEVIRAGADGVAVVSAVCAAPSPAEAAGRMRREIAAARQSRAG